MNELIAIQKIAGWRRTWVSLQTKLTEALSIATMTPTC